MDLISGASDVIVLLMAVAFLLIIISGLFFIILVTYLRQWDIYYPRLGRWLKDREKAQAEKIRKEKKRAGKLARKEKLNGDN